MQHFFRYVAGVVGLLSACVSCTVYAPMQPTMPLVRAAGATELSATVQTNGRVDATVAYSPAQSVVFTGAVAGSARLAPDNYLKSQQYEIGGGLYHALGPRVLLSGLGGFGQARNTRGYPEFLGSNTTINEYRANYRTYFVQIGVANTDPKDTFGFTYRLTQVHFNELTVTGVGPVPLTEMRRHEGLLFTRFDVGPSPTRWQLQATMGLSVASTPTLDRNASPLALHVNTTLQPAFLLGFGVVYMMPGNR